MVNFIALYRGRTLGDAQLVAVTSDPAIISEFARRLLAQPVSDSEDPVLREIRAGKRRALALACKSEVADGHA